jgi:hypothetical protein
MTRESVEQKATRLLLARRVILWRVGPKRIDASVHGDSGTYRVLWHTGAWSCSCPAYAPKCAHITAVGFVALPPPGRRHLDEPKSEPDTHEEAPA